MDVTPYLKLMVEKGASDLFFSVGTRPNIKIEGRTLPVGSQAMDSKTVHDLAYGLMSDEQASAFESTLELNMAVAPPDIGRFRVNVFRQRGEVAMVVRYIKSEVPSIRDLGLPPVLEDLIARKQGLLLIVGATGSGKSTTLASMIDFRNTTRTGHILTIEDPIEFVHEHKKSIVDQREVGLDTLSYEDGLRNALREAPDVIVVGEIRDRETMEHAIHYAETGHLCVSTLHAANANQALERIVNFFPENAHPRLLQDLSLHVQGIVAQRLLRSPKGTRVAAVEVMLNSPYISDLIAKGRIAEIKEGMEKGGIDGMQTFDEALFRLWKQGLVTKADALRNADSANNLRIRIDLEAPADAGRGVDLTIDV